jgi:hypothetical protein
LARECSSGVRSCCVAEASDGDREAGCEGHGDVARADVRGGVGMEEALLTPRVVDSGLAMRAQRHTSRGRDE